MKHIIILIDGMADEKIESLGNKTPLQAANIPNIDALAKVSELGMVHTVPEGMPAGSDVANLSVMGYDPKIYHTGRSPLEAVSVGIELNDTDVTFRCNLVTLSEEKDISQRTMIDHSSSDITSEEAEILMKDLQLNLDTNIIKYHAGVSYRNIITWKDGTTDVKLVPPHDFLEQKLTDYLPSGTNSEKILEMTKRSFEILNNHPINNLRREKGLNPANSIWIWGEGKKPILDNFKDKYGLDGSAISAVDLIKGIAMCAGLNSVDVEGATGTINTDFIAKANAALKEFKDGKDYVYLHLEAPDECSHQGNLEEKIRSIEIIDEKVVKYIKEELDRSDDDYRILLVPDHPTPVRTRTHTSNPVPFLIYDSTSVKDSGFSEYSEITCEKSGFEFFNGPLLTKYFIKTNVKKTSKIC